MQILTYIQSESNRQNATIEETLGMVNAWSYLRDGNQVPTLDVIRATSSLITGHREFRKVPAVFNQGPPAIKASLIPRAMDQWMGYAVNVGFGAGESVDPLIKNFLDIHPFADGNGRVASLLYNLFHEQMYDPQMLPYFYGQH